MIEDFYNAVEVINMRDQRDQPVKLIEKAINALESIDRESKHFREDRVNEAILRLLKIVQGIQKDLNL